jgi:hypothetical protein
LYIILGVKKGGGGSALHPSQAHALKMRLIFVIILLKRRCWSFSLKSYYINVRLLSERWTLQPSKAKVVKTKEKRKVFGCNKKRRMAVAVLCFFKKNFENIPPRRFTA